MFNKKKFAGDFLYNLLASFVSTGTLQIIVYPVLAKIFSASVYGELLTAMGIMNTLALSVGNSLNNTRLIQDVNYQDKGLKGDFNPLLIIFTTIMSSIILIFGMCIFEFSISICVFSMILVFVLSLKSYYVVTYRLILDFKKNLKCNIYTAVGYIVGLVLAFVSHQWPIVFIVAELFGLWYIRKTSKILKEDYKFTINFKSTFLKFITLMLVTLSANVMIYLDRMIIYPVLGSESVSIYTVAVFFGKAIGIVMTPMANVLLGYFAQKGFTMSLKRFWTMNGIVLMLAVAFMGISFILAPKFTKFLYPTLYEAARPYIFWANLAAVIGIVANMAQPAILKFAPTYWQIIKEIFYVIVYLSLGFLLLERYNLMGFCIASIGANLSRLIVLYLIGTVQFAKFKPDSKIV